LLNKVEIVKDRQERAIFAFTAVTIIFLPLSAVSSIFGMNTSDFRDMELGQWAYWATSVPLTVVIITIGLWWMGELGRLFSRLASVFKGPDLASLPRLPASEERKAATAATVVNRPPQREETGSPYMLSPPQPRHRRTLRQPYV
jgi:hypothetical protein